MKHLAVLIASGPAAAAVATRAFAGDPTARHPLRDRLHAADTKGDGRISREEAQANGHASPRISTRSTRTATRTSRPKNCAPPTCATEGNAPARAVARGA